MKTFGAVLAVVLTFGVFAAAVGGARPPRIPVWVRGAGETGGFTDPSHERRDSTRDLLFSLEHSDMLRVADSEDEASIEIEVLGRETRREVNALTLIGGHAQNKSQLHVRIRVGEYAAEFSGDGGSSGTVTNYSGAAKKVVSQIEEWALDNSQQLAATTVLAVHVFPEKDDLAAQGDTAVARETAKAIKDVRDLLPRRTKSYEVPLAAGFSDAQLLLGVRCERTRAGLFVVALSLRTPAETATFRRSNQDGRQGAVAEAVADVHAWIAKNWQGILTKR